jgi:hypothetical protein
MKNLSLLYLKPLKGGGYSKGIDMSLWKKLVARWGSGAGEIDDVSIDASTNALISVTNEHHEIHDGSSYEIHVDSANATVASMEIAFKTLTGSKLAHMLFGFSSNDEISFAIYEGASWDASSGTAVPAKYNNRSVAAVSTLILEDTTTGSFDTIGVTKNPTNSAVGGADRMEFQYTYNASLGVSVTAESRHAAHEWVLKANTTYLIIMTATDANCKMSIDLHWYEHTNKN